MNTKINLRKGFTLFETLLVVGLVALLATGFVIAINPAENINNGQDSIRSADVKFIDSALSVYFVENQDYPTAGGGTNLPIVTVANSFDNGVDVNTLDNFFPEYITTNLLDPLGNEYRVGMLDNGDPVVAIRLSSGEILTSYGLLGRQNEDLPDLTIGQVIKVNAQNGLDLGNLVNNDVIDLGVTPQITFRAFPNDQSDVDRIEFFVDGTLIQNETRRPYFFEGDTNGSPIAWSVTPGTYTISMTAFNNINRAGPTRSFSVQIVDNGGGGGAPVDPFSIESVLLANAATGNTISTLSDGQVINLSTYPSISLIAVPAVSANIDRVDFFINGSFVRSEGVEPYTIAGDGGWRNYFNWPVTPGSYSLEVVPIGYDRSRYAGYTVNFVVTN